MIESKHAKERQHEAPTEEPSSQIIWFPVSHPSLNGKDGDHIDDGCIDRDYPVFLGPYNRCWVMKSGLESFKHDQNCINTRRMIGEQLIELPVYGMLLHNTVVPNEQYTS